MSIGLAIQKTLREYAARVSAFQWNARLFLLNLVITGAAMGIFRLLFNFYVLSLGYDQALIGSLVTAQSLTMLIAALPMGFLADKLGRKVSLILAGIVTGVALSVMFFWPYAGVFYAMNLLLGISQALAGVVMAPFIMENSNETERTYLFSFGAGLQMASMSVGSWIGGYLPAWVGLARTVSATSSLAYGVSILVTGVAAWVGTVPLFFLKTTTTGRSGRTVFAPFDYAARQPVLLVKLILPLLITSIGAGLIMPFMNVFFRDVYGQPDPVIGALFAWGSLAMGLGLLAAPPLADRMGKIPFVVITQALSIPFLILLGFSPWFWLSAAAYYVRVALMNMSSPIYQTFVMEHVDEDARATVASLVSMAGNAGWAFSPTLSGWMQVRYGFTPPFLGTIILYTISVILYWAYFWRRSVAIETASEQVGR